MNKCRVTLDELAYDHANMNPEPDEQFIDDNQVDSIFWGSDPVEDESLIDMNEVWK